MKNNWKEEFDNLMDNYLRHFADAVISKRVIESINKEQDNILYSFITSLLAQQKKELIDELPEELGENSSERNEAYKKGFNFCREKIIHIIKNYD